MLVGLEVSPSLLPVGGAVGLEASPSLLPVGGVVGLQASPSLLILCQPPPSPVPADTTQEELG